MYPGSWRGRSQLDKQEDPNFSQILDTTGGSSTCCSVRLSVLLITSALTPMAFRLGVRRLPILLLAVLLAILFLLHTVPTGFVVSPIEAMRDGASSTSYKRPRPPVTGGFGPAISELYEPIKLPVTAESYTDQRGYKWDNGGRNYWQAGWGNDVLIVDIDTRFPDATNDIFGGHKVDWEAVRAKDGSLLMVAHTNNFILL